LSQAPGGWDGIFADLDKAGFPNDFLAERDLGRPQQRAPPADDFVIQAPQSLYGLNFLHFSLRFLSASALMKTPPTTDRAWK
jgi:hypothetical protein